MKTKLTLFAYCTFAFIQFAVAQPGTIDLGFNSVDQGFGKGFGPSGSNNPFVYSANVLSDGKILIFGAFEKYNGVNAGRIVRLNPNGLLDPTFTPGSGANGVIKSSAIASDGKIVIAGGFSNYNGSIRNCIARLNTNGTLDASFNPGTGANWTVETMVLQSDGKIVIGGQFSTYNGIASNRIARINTDGSLDETFNIGTGANNDIYGLSVQSDGKILVAGYFTSFNGTPANWLIRLNEDGSIDETFTIGTGPDNALMRVAVQDDGKILIGGFFLNYNGQAVSRLARLNEDGTLDASFNSSGAGPNQYVGSITIQSDGKIIIGGYFTTYNLVSSKYLARLNEDGSLDESFVIGSGADDLVLGTTIQPDGKVIVYGWLKSFNGYLGVYVLRIGSNGDFDNAFNPLTGADGAIRATALQSDDKIIIGGDFTGYNGYSRNRIARINPDGSIDNTFNPGTGVVGIIYSITVQPDGKIIIGGDFSAYNGVNVKHIARLNSDGSLDNTFTQTTGPNFKVVSTAIDNNGKILIGGHFTLYNGVAINRIARLNSNGTLDGTFTVGTGASDGVVKIHVYDDDKILISGSFTSYNSTSRKYIARLNSDGSLDGTFTTGTGADSYILSFDVQPDKKIVVVGYFSSYSGFPRGRITRLNSDGTQDGTFFPGTGASYDVLDVKLQSDGKIIIVGEFGFFSGTQRMRIARVNTDGSLDVAFNPGSGFSNRVHTALLVSNGKLILGGEFTSYNGIGRNSLARVRTCGDTGVDVITACESYTWIDGVTYTENNSTATWILPNVFGCDSIVTLNLTVGYSNNGIDLVTACESYTWIDGETYTESNNTATWVLPNMLGCDSTVTLNLTITYNNSGTDIISACNSYTWIDGITYTQSNNTATWTLPNEFGCDSVVTLDLTINLIDYSVSVSDNTLSANQNGATYQWVDCNNGNEPIEGETNQSFTPTQSGSYAVSVSYNGCSNISNCFEVTVTDINDNNSLDLNLSVYPNPSSGKFIFTSTEIIQSVTVFNAIGAKVQALEVNSSEFEIDLTSQPQGVFLYQLVGQGKTIKTGKLITK